MNEARCSCGAVGHVLPPGLGHDGPRDVQGPVMQWRGGRVGPGRVAIEAARSGVATCPACQHRASVFMLAEGDGQGAR